MKYLVILLLCGWAGCSTPYPQHETLDPPDLLAVCKQEGPAATSDGEVLKCIEHDQNLHALLETKCGETYFNHVAQISQISEWNETHEKAS